MNNENSKIPGKNNFRTDPKSHYAIELTEKKRNESSINDLQKEEYDPYKNRIVEHPTT